MPKKSLKVGLIGCGAMGAKRLEAIQRTGLGTVTATYDPKTKLGPCVDDASEVWAKCDIGIVATPHSSLALHAKTGLDLDKYVLVEKPGAIGRQEMEWLCQPKCKIGYNHRFHPAAKEIAKHLKAPLWIRAAYGHGGRPGYEKEWRLQRDLSGGGEILDQGVHLLDLAQYWLKEPFASVGSLRHNAFYPSTEEDNGFLLLRSQSGVALTLHCSATQWKNLFRVEIGCRDDLWVWEGLGTENYGAEKLIRYQRNSEGGKPTETTRIFPEGSRESWDEEWRHFYGYATGDVEVLQSTPHDSLRLFEVLEKVYNEPTLKRADCSSESVSRPR